MMPRENSSNAVATASLEASEDLVTQAISALNLQLEAPASEPSSAGILLGLTEAQDALVQPLLNAAAMVSNFAIKELKPLLDDTLTAGKATIPVLRMIAKNTRRINVGADKGNHSLDLAVRRAVFRTLGTRENILAAANAAGSNPNDLVGVMLREFLENKLRPLSELNREQVSALATVRRWLEGIVSGLPSNDAIVARVAEIDLTAPLERLLRAGFVGREAELRVLREYVDTIPSQSFRERFLRFTQRIMYAIIDRPPLMIFGPGGIGKSTLVAKFIVDHLEGGSSGRIPFVYIDFDRMMFREPQPNAVLREILRQLAVQYPSMRAEVDDFNEQLLATARRVDAQESAKSTTDDEYTFEQVSGIIKAHVDGRAPILLVLDTFEELQYLGRDVVYNYIVALDRLLRDTPRLRIVISGRADIADEELTTAKLPLVGFDQPSAELFLNRYIASRHDPDAAARITPEIIGAAVGATGGSPLTLTLAGENLIRAAATGNLDSIADVAKFITNLAKDTAQEQLYGRFLEHLHDDALRAVAYPGLVLRRIDADILLNVLAKPCRIVLRNATEAQGLVDSLRREGALVVPEENGPGVRHLLAVRRLMLPDIEKTMPERMRAIERRAAAYYHERFERTGLPLDRAEELYHLMRLGYSAATLEKRWLDALRPYLQDAVDEVPAKYHFWLTEKLRGGTDSLDESKLAQVEWERLAERRARNLLAAGNAQRAIGELRARDTQSYRPGSPLFSLLADALRLLGDNGAALDVISIGIKISDVEGGSDAIAGMATIESNIHESHHAYADALDSLKRLDSRWSGISADNRLRLCVTKARLIRKIAPYIADTDQSRIDILAQAHLLLDASAMKDVAKRPALLRECAAELAPLRTDLVELAIRTIGIELIDRDITEATGEALQEWDASTIERDANGMPINQKAAPERKSKKGKSPRKSSRSGTQPRGAIWKALVGDRDETPDFEAWLLTRRSGDPTKAMARLFTRYPMNTESAKAFGEVYALIVDRSIERNVKRAV